MTTPQPVTAQDVRRRVDAMAPRTHRDGTLNASHVAIEQTLRSRHGLPTHVPELDGPGQYLPDGTVEVVAELVTHLQQHRRDCLRALRAHPDGRGDDYWRWQGHAELARQLLERLGAEVPR